MNTHSVNYDLNSFLINAQGKLGLYQLLNLLQDSASSHAENLGLGLKAMEQMKMFWVLTRQNVKMDHWPSWHESITVKTWIRMGEGPASSRDFQIIYKGQVIGEATTSWLALGAQTRRPVTWDRDSIIGNLQHSERVSLDTGKIPIQKESEILTSFRVRNSDLDQNLHVNNTKYAQWVLDALPFEDHFRYRLKGYEVNFLAETKLNDEIRVERALLSPNQAHFQGVRLSDNKPVFTSLLSFEEKSGPLPAL